jgi:hypothetical protein
MVHGQSVVEALFISPEGNVGIGTTSPTTKLDVNGAITASADGNRFVINGNYIQQYLDTTPATMYLNWFGGDVNVQNVLSAGSFVGNGTIPVGGIIMWSGSVNDIPAGWTLCNGTQGTPDLRDRFVVGAGKSYNPGQAGGSTSVRLSQDNLPDFNVTGNVGTGSHSFSITSDFFAMAPGKGQGNGWKAFSYPQDFNNNSFSILPPYYALAYIMRTR